MSLWRDVLPTIRSFVNAGRRWVGSVGSAPIIQDLDAVASPVVIVGQEESDGGGLTSVGFDGVPPVGSYTYLWLAPVESMLVYEVRAEARNTGDWQLFVRVREEISPVAGVVETALESSWLRRPAGATRLATPPNPVVAMVGGQAPGPPGAAGALYAVRGNQGPTVVQFARPVLVAAPNRFEAFLDRTNGGGQPDTLAVTLGGLELA